MATRIRCDQCGRDVGQEQTWGWVEIRSISPARTLNDPPGELHYCEQCFLKMSETLAAAQGSSS